MYSKKNSGTISLTPKGVFRKNKSSTIRNSQSYPNKDSPLLDRTCYIRPSPSLPKEYLGDIIENKMTSSTQPLLNGSLLTETKRIGGGPAATAAAAAALELEDVANGNGGDIATSESYAFSISGLSGDISLHMEDMSLAEEAHREVRIAKNPRESRTPNGNISGTSKQACRQASKPFLLEYCKLMRPLAFSLTVCGMLTTVKFDPEIRAALTAPLFPFKHIQLACNSPPYSTIMLLLLWFNFGRWYVDWKSFKVLKWKVHVIVNLYLVWTLFAIVHNCLDIMHGASAYADVLTAPFKNVPRSAGFFFLGINMLATAAMNLPLVMFVATCMLLSEQFRNIAQLLEVRVQQTKKLAMSPIGSEDEPGGAKLGTLNFRELELLRMHHQYMTNTVHVADKIYSRLLLLTFTANLPLSCLSIYSLTKETETLPFISLIVWLVVGLMNVALVSWFAGGVVEQAHAPLQHIYNIRVPQNASESFVLQVNLFLSKLDGAPIAFTLSNLASVTKSFAVTMAGLCLTYTAIAIQISPLFERPEGTASSMSNLCNYTGNFTGYSIFRSSSLFSSK